MEKRTMAVYIYEQAHQGYMRWLVLILLLQCLSYYSNSWYVVSLDLNKCSDCGRFIVAMGTNMENVKHCNVFIKKLEAKRAMCVVKRSVETEITIGSHSTHVHHGDDGAKLQIGVDSVRSRNGINSDDTGGNIIEEEFVIDSKVFLYLGLLQASLCLEGTDGCYMTYIQSFVDQTPEGEPFSAVRESLGKVGALYLASVILSAMALLSACVGALGHDPKFSKSKLLTLSSRSYILSSISGILSVTGGAYIGAIQIINTREDVTLLLPSALVTCFISGYLSLYLAYKEHCREQKARLYQTNTSFDHLRNYV